MTYGRLRWPAANRSERVLVWHVLYGTTPIAWCSRRFDWHELVTDRAPVGVPCRQCAGALDRFGSEGVVSAGLYEATRDGETPVAPGRA